MMGTCEAPTRGCSCTGILDMHVDLWGTDLVGQAKPSLRRRKDAGHDPAQLRQAGGKVRDPVKPLQLRVTRFGLRARQRPALDPLRR
jgi:hypothetical protein